jgi:hypothetical protein
MRHHNELHEIILSRVHSVQLTSGGVETASGDFLGKKITPASKERGFLRFKVCDDVTKNQLTFFTLPERMQRVHTCMRT